MDTVTATQLELENVLLSGGFLLLGGLALAFSVWATRRWG